MYSIHMKISETVLLMYNLQLSNLYLSLKHDENHQVCLTQMFFNERREVTVMVFGAAKHVVELGMVSAIQRSYRPPSVTDRILERQNINTLKYNLTGR